MAGNAIKPLEVRTLHDVTIQPIQRSGRGVKPTFGAHDANGTVIEDFYRPLVDRWCTVSAPVKPTRHVAECRIYGGTMIGHYGHFILESLARCWAFDRHPHARIVWTKLQIGNSHERWSPWMARLLGLLGIELSRIEIIDQPTAFREIILPDSGFRYFSCLHPAQAERLKVVGRVESSPAGKVWLSRSGLPPGFSRVQGEDLLELLLRDAGWTIVSPENLPIEEQAGMFHNADVIAGFSTSAFHNVLLQKIPRARLRIFVRDTIPLTNYEVIADRLALDQAFLAANVRQLDQRSARSSYVLEDPDAAFRTLLASI